MIEAFLKRPLTVDAEARRRVDALTARSQDVLRLLARGLTNAALAEELCVSTKTVEGYVRSIFTKLDLAPGERDHRRVLAVLRFLRRE